MAGILKDFCNPYIYAVKLVNVLFTPPDLYFLCLVLSFKYFKSKGINPLLLLLNFLSNNVIVLFNVNRL